MESPGASSVRSGLICIPCLAGWGNRSAAAPKVARDHADLTEYAAWPQQQDGAERRANQHNLERRRAGLLFRRKHR